MVDLPSNLHALVGDLNILVESELPPQTLQCSVDMYRQLKNQLERLGFTVELNRTLRNEVLLVSQDVYEGVDPLYSSDSGV